MRYLVFTMTLALLVQDFRSDFHNFLYCLVCNINNPSGEIAVFIRKKKSFELLITSPKIQLGPRIVCFAPQFPAGATWHIGPAPSCRLAFPSLTSTASTVCGRSPCLRDQESRSVDQESSQSEIKKVMPSCYQKLLYIDIKIKSCMLAIAAMTVAASSFGFVYIWWMAEAPSSIM